MSITKHIPKISEEEITPTVTRLLELIQILIEENENLKDEIARLKGQKPRPKIKPSNLAKEDTNKQERDKTTSNRTRRSKTKEIKIHQEIPIQPENIPHGSKFIDYKDYIVQNIIFCPWNIRYRRGRWQTPSGDFIIGELPKDVKGHFGSDLISFILYQYYGCCVTQPLIAQQLNELQIEISTGQINNILIEKKELFHKEKEEILLTGLKISNHINVDDTGARHKGNNGYCTHIGNEYFAWFETTQSKSRINFLKLLRLGHNDFIINADALEYMAVQGLPRYQLNKLGHKIFKDENEWSSYLKALGIVVDHHVRIATEGALVGSIIYHGFNKDLAIISDDAGQFNIFLHGLCWVHAERSVHKLIGFTEHHKKLLEDIRADIWQFYRDLKDYRINPEETTKIELNERFDKLFIQKTGFASLDQALKRIHKNKSELLLVLDRPDIPLHNNLSETDIREYVKRRKISGSTRSDNGKRGRDTFTSLKKTCRKLGIPFWEYLDDRIRGENKIPPLADVMKLKIAESFP
jgi:hypothetical protein